MLHLPPRFLLPHLEVSSSSSRRRLGIDRPLSLFLDVGDIRSNVGLRGPAKRCENSSLFSMLVTFGATWVYVGPRNDAKIDCKRGRPDASKPIIKYPGGSSLFLSMEYMCSLFICLVFLFSSSIYRRKTTAFAIMHQ